jgi:hypothetical protein
MFQAPLGAVSVQHDEGVALCRATMLGIAWTVQCANQSLLLLLLLLQLQ